MKFSVRLVLAAMALCIGSGAALAQGSGYGPQVGVYFPASQELRNALGSSWFSIGFTQVPTQRAGNQIISTDWNVLAADRYGNRLFILTPSVGILLPLGGDGQETNVYAAARAGISYMDYNITTGGVTRRGNSIGLNGNVELGMYLGDRLNVAARYDVFSEKDGLNFNGLTLSLRYSIVRF